MLQRGTPVIWLGKSLENPAFHKIQYHGQIGYMLPANLSTTQFAEFKFNNRCHAYHGTSYSKAHAPGSKSPQLGLCIFCKSSGQDSGFP